MKWTKFSIFVFRFLGETEIIGHRQQERQHQNMIIDTTMHNSDGVKTEFNLQKASESLLLSKSDLTTSTSPYHVSNGIQQVYLCYNRFYNIFM